MGVAELLLYGMQETCIGGGVDQLNQGESPHPLLLRYIKSTLEWTSLINTHIRSPG